MRERLQGSCLAREPVKHFSQDLTEFLRQAVAYAGKRPHPDRLVARWRFHAYDDPLCLRFAVAGAPGPRGWP